MGGCIRRLRVFPGHRHPNNRSGAQVQGPKGAEVQNSTPTSDHPPITPQTSKFTSHHHENSGRQNDRLLPSARHGVQSGGSSGTLPFPPSASLVPRSDLSTPQRTDVPPCTTPIPAFDHIERQNHFKLPVLTPGRPNQPARRLPRQSKPTHGAMAPQSAGLLLTDVQPLNVNDLLFRYFTLNYSVQDSSL